MIYKVRIECVMDDKDEEFPPTSMIETHDDELAWALTKAIAGLGEGRLCQLTARVVFSLADMDKITTIGNQTNDAVRAFTAAARAVVDAWDSHDGRRASV